MMKSKGMLWSLSSTLLMSSESWKRLQSDGTRNLLSGIACLSPLDVKRMGILVILAGAAEGPAATPAAEVLASGTRESTAAMVDSASPAE